MQGPDSIGETPPDLRTALQQTIALLETHFGRIDPLWGEVNRLKTKPVWFTRAELDGHAKRDYRPGRVAAKPLP